MGRAISHRAPRARLCASRDGRCRDSAARHAAARLRPCACRCWGWREPAALALRCQRAARAPRRRARARTPPCTGGCTARAAGCWARRRRAVRRPWHRGSSPAARYRADLAAAAATGGASAAAEGWLPAGRTMRLTLLRPLPRCVRGTPRARAQWLPWPRAAARRQRAGRAPAAPADATCARRCRRRRWWPRRSAC